MPGELSPGQLKSVENKGGFLITGGFLINISTDWFIILYVQNRPRALKKVGQTYM